MVSHEEGEEFQFLMRETGIKIVISHATYLINLFEVTSDTINRLIGLEKLHAIHLNNSKDAYGNCVDRHDHIGKGEIGIEAFRFAMENFPHIPKVIETNK